ncbi:MAG: YggT family protein [bacterium]|nr:YggT family protein [bacterium]
MHNYKPITYIIDFVMTIAIASLMIRFLLKLFSANPAAPFVKWMYAVSDPLLAPFRGIFPATSLEDGFIIEFATLFAIAMYALLQYLLIQLVAYVGSAHKQVT